MEPGEAFRRDVSRETRERLDIYESLLRRRQQRTNLVSAASLPALWTRHFLDSAQLAPLLADDATGHTVDVGSGAGFPGMVLAIMQRPPRHSGQANGKRCAFLREVAVATGTAVSVIEGPARGAGASGGARAGRHDRSPRVRAVGRIARSCFPCVGTPYILYIPEGAPLPGELEEARGRWDFRADIVPSRTAAEARILRISDVERRRS